MLYYADRFNQEGLFQKMGGMLAGNPAPHFAPQCVTVLGRAYQALFHLDNVRAIANHAVGQFRRASERTALVVGAPPLDGELLGLSPVVFGMLHEVSSTLTALRILQDECWKLVAMMCAVRGQTSDSMHAAAAAISKGKVSWLAKVPAQVAARLTSYWNASGSRLRDYRVLDQHYAFPTTRCVLGVTDSVVTNLRIPLPDNPQSNSPSKFTYTLDVDALAYLPAAFAELHQFIEDVIVGDVTSAIARTVHLAPAVPHQPGIERATVLVLWDDAGAAVSLIGQTADCRATLTTPP